MANDVKFEGKERRMAKIEKCLAEYGLASLEEARDLCLSKGINVEEIVKGVQPIAFENAVWAYTLGVAIALKTGVKAASEAAATIGQRLAGILHPRLCCRAAQCWPWPWQSWRNALKGRNKVLCFPCRP